MIDVYVERSNIDYALMVGARSYRLLCELLPERYSEQTPESFAKPAQQLIGSKLVLAPLAKTKTSNPIGIITLKGCASMLGELLVRSANSTEIRSTDLTESVLNL